MLHAYARCKQRLAPGLSRPALIDECGIAIGLVSMIPALQEDEEGAALEEGTFEREHSWSFMKRLVLASWGAIRGSDRGDKHGIGGAGPRRVPLRRIG